MSYAPNQILRWRQLHQLRSLLKNTSDEVALGRLSEDVGSFRNARDRGEGRELRNREETIGNGGEE
jgi:hypothetical protein